MTPLFFFPKMYDPPVYLGPTPFRRKCQPPKWYPWCLGTFKIKPRIVHPVYSYLSPCYVLSIDKFWTYNVLLARASKFIDADSLGFLRSSIFVGPQYHFLSISLLQQCQIQICSSLLFILACKWKSWFSDFNTIAQIRYHGYTWSNWEQTVLIWSYLLFWSLMTWWSTPGLYCPRHTGSLWPTVPLLIC